MPGCETGQVHMSRPPNAGCLCVKYIQMHPSTQFRPEPKPCSDSLTTYPAWYPPDTLAYLGTIMTLPISMIMSRVKPHPPASYIHRMGL